MWTIQVFEKRTGKQLYLFYNCMLGAVTSFYSLYNVIATRQDDLIPSR